MVMRFEVPQYIDIEDKIIGPLTWKQFIYISGGLGAMVVCFFWLPFILFMLVGIPIGALFAALAFYPINNRPFSIFLESVWKYFTNYRLYLWKRRSPFTPSRVRTQAHNLPPQTFSQKSDVSNSESLSSLSRKLELNALAKKE